jgi:hypothetical protein
LALAVLSGCAGNPLRSYDSEMGDTLDYLKEGKVDDAVEQLEANSEGFLGGKDLLYYFEKGELLRLKAEYAQSRDAWLKADEKVREWEDAARLDSAKVAGEIGSYLLSDRARRYDGQDYEKIFLSTRLALDHILLGSPDLARVEMAKTVERETLIGQLREKEYDALAEAGEEREIALSVNDLAERGYPLEMLDTPAVRALKNGYQNALAHYLAGYFFEMTDEPSLAAPGYRNARELRPESQYARAKAQSLGRRPGAKEADVLFIVESGLAPAWQSLSLPIPLRVKGSWIVLPFSFPLVVSSGAYMPHALSVAGRNLPVETLVDVDALAKRQLKDLMPGIVVRTAIRGAIKAAAQYAVQNSGNKKAAGRIAARIALAIASIATEQADERAWRTLPSQIAIARAILPAGEHLLKFRTARGEVQKKITVGGAVNIVPVRIVEDFVYVGGQTAETTLLPESRWITPKADMSAEEAQKRINALNGEEEEEEEDDEEEGSGEAESEEETE